MVVFVLLVGVNANAVVLSGNDQTFAFKVDPVPVGEETWSYLLSSDVPVGRDWIIAEFSSDGEEVKFYFLNSGTNWYSISEFNASPRSLVIVFKSGGGAALYVNGQYETTGMYSYWDDFVGGDVIVGDSVQEGSLIVFDGIWSDSQILAFNSSSGVTPLDSIYASASLSDYVGYGVGLLAGLVGIAGLSFGFNCIRKVM
jgi:hypothetical protein